MKPKECVLIVEDDKSISKLLEFTLHAEGYRCLIAEDLKHARRHLNVEKPDIILLDLGLPDGDGKHFIATVRNELPIPIIIISARNDDKEVVASLDAGADDYVIKPFSTFELSARIRSAQRRALGTNTSSSEIGCGSLVLDLTKKVVSKQGESLKLTPTEFNLLRFCLLHPNQVLTHSRILKEVWGIGYQQEMQYLRTYINSLRKKIEDDATQPQYIVTEMGIGYRFVCRDESIEKD